MAQPLKPPSAPAPAEPFPFSRGRLWSGYDCFMVEVYLGISDLEFPWILNFEI
jgi:hypothetical protein